MSDSLVRQVILEINGWRKIVYISEAEHKYKRLKVRLSQPLSALIPTEQIPLRQEYVEVELFLSKVEDGMAVFTNQYSGYMWDKPA